jgi:hypothetical protein
MPRPPKQPNRADVEPEERMYWDRGVRRRTGDPVPETYDLGTYFGALMSSPPLCAIASEMGTFVRNAGNHPHTYTHAQRELVDQVLGADLKTNVVMYFHIQDAISSGVRMEAIKALRYGHEEDLNDEERLLAKYIRQVISGTVDDGTWQKMEELMGSERGVVEYSAFVLWLNWIMRMMQAMNTGTHTDEEVDQLIKDIESGKKKVADYRIGTATPESRYAR